MTTIAAPLAPEHLADLHKSGLNTNTIVNLQFSAVRPHELRKLKTNSAFRIPFFNIDGSVTGFERWKLFPPITDKQGHTQKYFQPQDSHPHLYLPPLVSWQAVANDTRMDLIIAEGEKKAACAVQREITTIGICGVWNWRIRLEKGERLIIPTLDLFQWQDRVVRLVPDSDMWLPSKSKRQGLSGFYALAMELQQRGATVSMLKLPHKSGNKVGLDDWLNLEPEQWDSHLEVVALDDVHQFSDLITWYQDWKSKEATQDGFAKEPELEINLTEQAGLFTVKVPVYGVAVLLDRLSESSSKINGELTVMLGGRELISLKAIELRSENALQTFDRSLRRQAPSVPWKLILERACAAVLKVHRQGQPSITVDEQAEPETLTYAVEPLVFEKKVTVLYGDGGLGKSTLALAIAMAVSVGISFAGFTITKKGKPLLLDYEDDRDVHVRRFHAILAGHPELRGASVEYQRCTEPFVLLTHQLARTIQEKEITFLVIDSLAAATAGDASAESATKFFTALRTLNVDSFVLGHVAKNISEGETVPSIYGSVFNKNLSRSTWELKKEQEVGEDTAILGLFNRKVNYACPHHPIGIRVTHSRDNKFIRFESAKLEESPTLETALPLQSRIYNFLKGSGALHSAGEIADALEVSNPRVVSTTLLRWSRPPRCKFHKHEDGKNTKWYVL